MPRGPQICKSFALQSIPAYQCLWRSIRCSSIHLGLSCGFTIKSRASPLIFLGTRSAGSRGFRARMQWLRIERRWHALIVECFCVVSSFSFPDSPSRELCACAMKEQFSFRGKIARFWIQHVSLFHRQKDIFFGADWSFYWQLSDSFLVNSRSVQRFWGK